MRLLKNILDFYIRSSLHVAVCFVVLLRIVKTHGVFQFKPELYALSFGLVLISYNFIKYGDLIVRKKNFRFKSLIILLSLVASFPILWLVVNDNYRSWFILFCILILVIFYSIPFFKGKSLRHGIFFKVISVVICWCLLLTIFPLYSDYAVKRTITCSWYNPHWIYYLLRFIQLFTFVFALCIPFEIRDLKYDSINVKTIPQIVGVKNSKVLGYVLIIIFLIIQLIIYSQTDLLHLELILTSIVLGVAIYFSDKCKSDYYASFFVEAIPVLWLGLYYLL